MKDERIPELVANINNDIFSYEFNKSSSESRNSVYYEPWMQIKSEKLLLLIDRAEYC